MSLARSAELEQCAKTMGLKAYATPAQQSAKSSSGTCGGTAVLIQRSAQCDGFREWAAPGTATTSTATVRGKRAHEVVHQFFDWTPVTLYMKGYAIVVISLYLNTGESLQLGDNARKLTSLAS